MQKIPDLEKLNIKDILSYGGAMERGEERAKKHDKAASLYNHVRALKINRLCVHMQVRVSTCAAAACLHGQFWSRRDILIRNRYFLSRGLKWPFHPSTAECGCFCRSGRLAMCPTQTTSWQRMCTCTASLKVPSLATVLHMIRRRLYIQPSFTW